MKYNIIFIFLIANLKLFAQNRNVNIEALKQSFGQYCLYNTSNISMSKNNISCIDNDLSVFWDKFTKYLITKNYENIRKLSTEYIYCPFCVTDTPEKDSLFEIKKRTDGDLWIKKLYSELCFISIEKFLLEDIFVIINKNVELRLLDKSNLNFSENKHNSKLYKRCIPGFNSDAISSYKEIIINIVDSTPECDGFSYAFAVVKVNGIYKFCGFSTIP